MTLSDKDKWKRPFAYRRLDPDLTERQFLMARGEFSAFVEISFDKYLRNIRRAIGNDKHSDVCALPDNKELSKA